MRSLNRLGTRSVSIPLSADDVVEFHAARLLLLLDVCGTAGRIDSLTKMAKLDFFARYPDFFEAARQSVEPNAEVRRTTETDADLAIESAMVRHHYGPWDKRYYHVLSHLEARRLITVAKEGSAFRLSLTDAGRERARTLSTRPSFATLVSRMRQIKSTFGRRTGSSLKALIYRLFDEEVGRRPMGKVIR